MSTTAQEIDGIKIFSGGDMDLYDCIKAYKTLSHPDYCCPFCSHGETIRLKVSNQYRGRLLGTYRRAYLECSETCMSYGIFEKSFLHGWTEDETLEAILRKAVEAFKKMVLYTKDQTEFIMAKPLTKN